MIKDFLIKGEKKNLLDNITTLLTIINKNSIDKNKNYTKMTKQQHPLALTCQTSCEEHQARRQRCGS